MVSPAANTNLLQLLEQNKTRVATCGEKKRETSEGEGERTFQDYPGWGIKRFYRDNECSSSTALPHERDDDSEPSFTEALDLHDSRPLELSPLVPLPADYSLLTNVLSSSLARVLLLLK